MSSTHNIITVALDMIGWYGTQAAQLMDRRAREGIDGGDDEGATFWTQVAIAIRALEPQPQSVAPRAISDRVFEATPHAYLVLDLELRIVGANDAYLAMTLIKRRELLGSELFEVFPDNPSDPTANGASKLRASLDLVREMGKPHRMPLQRYDIRSGDGVFLERWWLPLNVPVFDEGGRLVRMVHHVEDATRQVRPILPP